MDEFKNPLWSIPLNPIPSDSHIVYCGNGISFEFKCTKLMDLSSKEVLDYIKLLESQSFDGWSEDDEKGYRTACISITEKIKKLTNKLQNEIK